MEIDFDLQWKLSLHHTPCDFDHLQPEILICFDQAIDSKSVSIHLNTKNRLSKKIRGYKEEVTQSELYHFEGSEKRIQLKNITTFQKSSYLQFYHCKKNEFPTDTLLMFFIYAAHHSDEGFPLKVCVGCGKIELIQLKENKKTLVKISNRGWELGTILLNIHQITKPEQFKWKRVNSFSKKDVDDIAEKYAEGEYSLLSRFKKVWGGTKSMFDLFGFEMMGTTVPVAFFLKRLKSNQMEEEEFKIILFYACRRYAIETQQNQFTSVLKLWKKCAFKEKLSICSVFLTLIPTSHSYNTDYKISQKGKRKLIETFQSPGKSDSGDCEELGGENFHIEESMIYSLSDDLDRFRKKKFKHSILREIQCILGMYTEEICLWRTTTRSLNIPTSLIKEQTSINSRRTFSSIEQKRRVQCQGSNTKVSAHMSCTLTSTDTFIKNMNIEANPEFEQKEEFEQILQKELNEFYKNVSHYKKTYSQSFKTDSLLNMSLEGTGIFNSVNKSDPFLVIRDKLMSEVPVLYDTKYTIYHPTGDPKQFYLNLLSFITPRYIRKYGFYATDFILGYKKGKSRRGRGEEEEGEKGNIYGITFNDWINKKKYEIVPNRCLQKENGEQEMMIATSKRQVCPPIYALKKNVSFKDDHLTGIQDALNKGVQSFCQLFDYNNQTINIDSSSSSSSSRSYFGKNPLDKTYNEAIRVLKQLIQKFRQHPITQNKIRLNQGKEGKKKVHTFFVFKPILFFYEDIVTNLLSQLLKSTLDIVQVEFYREIFGENMRNIIFVITVEI